MQATFIVFMQEPVSHAAEAGLHIALKAEPIFHVGSFPITNTLLMTWVVMLVLGIMAILVGMSVKKIPSRVQTFFELVFGGLLDYIETVLESRNLALKFFPLLATIFLFILFGNWLGLVPGFEAIMITTEATHGEPALLFHPINTDLNTTLALAIIAFLVIEVTGVVMIGVLKYGGKFVNVSSVIGFFVGIIELVSELARLIAFSFRLFGNIFAGKVLLAVIVFFIPFVVPVPLMLFEIFVGFIQAAIFALLTLFFIKIAITESEAH